MRFAALAVLLVVAVSYGQAKSVEELIKMANEAGAPFTRVALESMNKTDLWGAKRGRSSADIVIINASGMPFDYFTALCQDGSFVSPGLVPESYLTGHTSTVLGLQSSVDTEHANVQCLLLYRFMFPSELQIFVFPARIPGGIEVHMRDSSYIWASGIVDQGENTQIIVQLENRYGGDVPVLQSKPAASLFPQRKLNWSRNLFVKASKSGSSIRTI